MTLARYKFDSAKFQDDVWARRRQAHSLTEFQQEIGCSISTLHRMLYGRTSNNAAFVYSVCKALNLSLEDYMIEKK